jgi:hypothetical protein
MNFQFHQYEEYACKCLQCELTLYRFSLLFCHLCVREVVNSVDCGMWDLQSAKALEIAMLLLWPHVGEVFEFERNDSRKKRKGYLISLMIQIL